jgi:MoxR-like ATPase
MNYTFTDIEALGEEIKQKAVFLDLLNQETAKVVVGQDHLMQRLCIALLTKGHILLEGMPGLAKTLAIKTLAQAVQGAFSRIQFTPDLLPSDIVGTQVYHPASGGFSAQKGPIFGNFVLADEINRAPAKVQSALLEAMQERQVTIGKETFSLPDPFIVLATQNPIDQEGTYPLAEAQSDRFLLKTQVGYPNESQEKEILQRFMFVGMGSVQEVKPVVSMQTFVEARQLVDAIYMDDKIQRYIINLVFASREPTRFGLKGLEPLLMHGASPRATIGLAQSAKAMAFLRRKAYVSPDEVRAMAFDVLRHRIGLTYEAEAENVKADEIITRILEKIEVP